MAMGTRTNDPWTRRSSLRIERTATGTAGYSVRLAAAAGLVVVAAALTPIVLGLTSPPASLWAALPGVDARDDSPGTHRAHGSRAGHGVPGPGSSADSLAGQATAQQEDLAGLPPARAPIARSRRRAPGDPPTTGSTAAERRERRAARAGAPELTRADFPPPEDLPPEDRTGIAVFPPPGTDPPKVGIVVPDDFPLPEGYVRHYQTNDDGKLLPPILMYSPDYEWVDADGRPIPTPQDRIVRKEDAPPGLDPNHQLDPRALVDTETR